MRRGIRLEQHPAFQAVVGVVMVVVMGSVVLWNLPAGPPHNAVRPTVGTVVQGLGLEQDWALFAPDPRAFSVGVYATITHRDGRVQRWSPPHNGLFFQPYRTYRWQKYVERLRADDYAIIWEPTAKWIARKFGPNVIKVVLTRTFQSAKVPGSKGARPPLQTYDFYTLDLP